MCVWCGDVKDGASTTSFTFTKQSVLKHSSSVQRRIPLSAFQISPLLGDYYVHARLSRIYIQQ